MQYYLLLSVCLWTLPSQAKQLNFLTFFGCSAEDNYTSLEEVEECDIFAYIGAEVAREVVNSDLSKPNITFHQEKIQSTIGSEVSLYMVGSPVSFQFLAGVVSLNVHNSRWKTCS